MDEIHFLFYFTCHSRGEIFRFRASLSCTNVEELIKESSSSYLGAFIDEPSRANRLGRVVQQHWP
jgi:hypothetical protein